jgi:hypothetical protein
MLEAPESGQYYSDVLLISETLPYLALKKFAQDTQPQGDLDTRGALYCTFQVSYQLCLSLRQANCI